MKALESGPVDWDRPGTWRRWLFGGLAAVCLAALVVARPVLGWALLGIWLAVNAFVAGVAAVWGFLHPRGILRASEAASRWAFWLTIVNGLWLAAGLEIILGWAERAGVLPVPAASTLVVAILSLVPLSFLAFLLLGQFGAALGTFAGRDLGDAARAARMGIGAWWL